MAGVSRVGSIEKMDGKYIKSGRWKCSDSPTGAHHSHEVSKSHGYGLFVCKYCGYVQRLPTDYGTAMRMTIPNNRELKDPMLDPKSL
ncbi:hypothetical protein LCGC14_0383190 [marine sediment metagenome]|uniref:Uncharacterized protein n=1 Tax=marine sediment metagenome TaxID=412755 RepID=A0A0F9T1I9_9ZZZZ